MNLLYKVVKRGRLLHQPGQSCQSNNINQVNRNDLASSNLEALLQPSMPRASLAGIQELILPWRDPEKDLQTDTNTRDSKAQRNREILGSGSSGRRTKNLRANKKRSTDK